MIAGLTFKSFNHFELISVCDVRWSCFICLQVDIQCPQHDLLKTVLSALAGTGIVGDDCRHMDLLLSYSAPLVCVSVIMPALHYFHSFELVTGNSLWGWRGRCIFF